MELRGTKTEGNMAAAFAGEAQMNCRYQFYAEKAESEGLHLIAKKLRDLARIELEHARLFYKVINYGDVPCTRQNLLSSKLCERLEHRMTYERYKNDAEKDGLPRIAALFQNVSRIEREHEQILSDLLDDLENEHRYEGADGDRWECYVCGHVAENYSAPESCPVCFGSREGFVKLLNHTNIQ